MVSTAVLETYLKKALKKCLSKVDTGMVTPEEPFHEIDISIDTPKKFNSSGKYLINLDATLMIKTLSSTKFEGRKYTHSFKAYFDKSDAKICEKIARKFFMSVIFANGVSAEAKNQKKFKKVLKKFHKKFAKKNLK